MNIQALMAKAAQRKKLTPEEIRERIRNSEHLKKLVEAFKKREE